MDWKKLLGYVFEIKEKKKLIKKEREMKKIEKYRCVVKIVRGIGNV